MFYDGLLLFSVLFFAGLVTLLFTHGQAIEPGNPLFTAYLLGVSAIYFAWPWVRSGQTLGMRAWRLRVQQRDGSPVTWRQALTRFFAAILSWLPAGLGFLWQLVDREHMSWHDRLSGTTLVIAPLPDKVRAR
jgi:uncharacterized RDD family membrane protein YckC